MYTTTGWVTTAALCAFVFLGSCGAKGDAKLSGHDERKGASEGQREDGKANLKRLSSEIARTLTGKHTGSVPPPEHVQYDFEDHEKQAALLSLPSPHVDQAVVGFRLDLEQRKVLDAEQSVQNIWVTDDGIVVKTIGDDSQERIVVFDKNTLARKHEYQLESVGDHAVDPRENLLIQVTGNKLRIRSLASGKKVTKKVAPLPYNRSSLVSVPGYGVIIGAAYEDNQPFYVLGWGKAAVVLEGEGISHSVTSSDDGLYIASPTGDGDESTTMGVWELGNGKLRTETFPHGTGVLGFLPQGHNLVLASSSGSWIWDLDSNKVLPIVTGGGNGAIMNGTSDPLLAPDSQLLVRVVNGHGGGVLLGSPVPLGGGRFVTALRHSVDETANTSPESLVFVETWRTPQATVVPLPFRISPDSLRLVVQENATLLLVGRDDGQEAALVALDGSIVHRFSEPCQKFNEDGEELSCRAKVDVVDDQYAVVWYGFLAVVYSLQSGKEIFRVEQSDVSMLSRETGKLLASLDDGFDCFVIASGKKCGRIVNSVRDPWLQDMNFSPDGEHIAIHYENEAVLVSLSQDKVVRKISRRETPKVPTRMGFAKDGSLIAIFEDDDGDGDADILYKLDGSKRFQDTTHSGLMRRVGDWVMSGTTLRNLAGEALMDVQGFRPEDYRSAANGKSWMAASDYPKSSARAIVVESPRL